MATVIDAEPIPSLPDLIDKIGDQQAWVTLDSEPAGDGKYLSSPATDSPGAQYLSNGPILKTQPGSPS